MRQWAAWWGAVLLAINPIHHCTEVGQCGWYACTPSLTEEQVITSVAHHSLGA